MRRHLTPPIKCCAAVCALALTTGVFAADATNTGAPGANGAPGKNGGNGKWGLVDITSSDIANTATATAGKGGNGGVSTATKPAGNGGQGGEGKSILTLKGQVYPPNELDVNVTGTVTAVGGDGGNGGLGPVLGKGGAGGFANAKGINYGGQYFEGAPDIREMITVNGVGGNGGAGRDGGAGGGSSASNVSYTEFQSTLTTTARGGNGGNALNQGGNGGNAAANTSSEDRYRRTLGSSSLAIGGNGGDSATGLNGNGGRATATVKGSVYGIRSYEDRIDLTANAIGGNSGVGGGSNPATGNGGDAFATVTSFSHPVTDWTGALPTATAQGGNGIARGGNAVATVSETADEDGTAIANATGGKGQIAGAAVATATVNNYAFGASVTATANSAGPFAKQVITTGSIGYDPDQPQNHQTLYTQSRVGDTTGLLATTPQPVGVKYAAVHAAAPTAQETTQFLAGNENLLSTFAGGSVWGIGEFDSGRAASGASLTASYLFDIDALVNPEDDLWLGFLEATIAPKSANNFFNFSIGSGGTTFFQHQFTNADFLTYFDDNPIDLGNAWRDLVGSDGLFKLDVSFAGTTSGFDFVFGNAPSAHLAKVADAATSVPEPSTIALLITGAIGIAATRRYRWRAISTP